MAEIYQPTLVIGLGGTGKNIILALKKMIAENCEHGMADFPFLELISLDTDELLKSAKSLIKTIKEEELSLNRNREVFKLHTNFINVPNLSDYPKIHEWFPDSYASLTTASALAIGAGQKKPVGRFSFAWNAGELYERIKNFIAAPVPAIEAKSKNITGKLSHTINVFICGSVCGGTGAGSFLDMAYLIRYIAGKNSGNGFTVRTFGMFALASLFDSIKGTPSIRSNCYASLVELDYFMNDINFKNKYRCFYPAYEHFPSTGDYGPSAQNKPFDHTFLFDKSGNGYALSDVSEFGEMAARFIYLLTTHDLSRDWFGMESNIDVPKDSVVNKSTEYYGMGTFSILYPKRMIVQLCAYNLSKEYLRNILKDDYAPQEIENLAKDFLKDIKMNPFTTQLEDAFDKFNDNKGFNGAFKEYISTEISDFSERAAEVNKKDLKEELLQWKKDIEAKVVEFGNLNSTKSRELREGFLSQLQLKLSEILDLHEHALGIKKDANGNNLLERGSIVRAQKFIECLIVLFNKAKETYRKKRADCESRISTIKSAFNEALEEFDEKIDSLFFANKKVAEAKDKILDTCSELFIAEKDNFVFDWCYQLFTDIMFGAVPKYSGLIKELENYQKKYQEIVKSFEELDKEVSKFLDSNKNYKSTLFFDALFDYDKDVVGTYKKLIEGKEKEDYVWGTLSDKLTKETCFNKDYTNAATMTVSAINLEILRETERFFFPLVKAVNIEDRILESPKIRERLESGQYFDLAAIYLGLDGSVLSSINRDFKNSTFFSISIPDNYEGKECAGIKGDGAAVAGRRCPMDESPEEFTGSKRCEKYGKCLKQMLLQSQNLKVAVTPTSEMSEINIIHTIKGYPLRAVSSVMSNCKPEYEVARNRQQQENEKRQKEYEGINMFGLFQFDALDKESVDPEYNLRKFRENLIIAYIAGRLKLQQLSVDFVTERDLAQDRKDKPSLHLGNPVNGMQEIMNRYQSSRLSDQKDISQFEKDVDHLRELILGKESMKDKFKEMARTAYEEMCEELPAGFVEKDIDLMDETVNELCGLKLIKTTELSDEELLG